MFFVNQECKIKLCEVKHGIVLLHSTNLVGYLFLLKTYDLHEKIYDLHKKHTIYISMFIQSNPRIYKHSFRIFEYLRSLRSLRYSQCCFL